MRAGRGSSRETRVLNRICIVLIISAGFLRLAGYRKFAYNFMIFALFSAAAFIWIFQIQRRLMQTEVRNNLTGVTGLIILWMAVRTFKYDFLEDGHLLTRYCWYMYYIPMVLIPLLMFLSVLWIGLPPGRTVSLKWKLLYVPAVCLILGVLTNDIHQQAFRFYGGLAMWNDHDNIRGPVYYAVMVWVVLLFFFTLIVVFSRCAVPASRRKIWIPMVPLLLGVIYITGILLKMKGITDFLREPEMWSFLFAAFMESLICVHLFPSNDRYEEFFHASSIGAGIMDRNGTVRHESAKSLPVTAEQIVQAQNESVLLADGNTVLRSHAIHGGFGYWFRDLTEINRINRDLADLGDIAAQENSMLEAEIRMEEERVRIEEQNRLYDDMAKGVKTQLDVLNQILNDPPEEETAFEKAMKYACILNAYVKRHSNLLLLSHQGDAVHSEELRRAIAESLEYVQMNGVRTQCTFEGKHNLYGRAALLAYEVFEAVLESAVPGADNLLVYGQVTENDLVLRIEIHAPASVFSDTRLKEQGLSGIDGLILETETEGDTEYVSVSIPSGGERL